MASVSIVLLPTWLLLCLFFRFIIILIFQCSCVQDSVL